MSTPKISIALATYNGIKYITEQLDSILSQTLCFHEIIICDDNSSDGTWNILEKYASTDSRIKVFKNTKNIGFKLNFENAISKCCGEYIALCDQDDIWFPSHLETLYNIIGNNMVACGNSILINAKGEKIGLTLQEMESFNYVPKDNMLLAYSVIFFRSPFQGASMLIKKDFLNYALPIPDSIKYHDSWFANLSLFCGGIIYTDEIINQYRMHGNNVTGTRVSVRSKIRTLVSLILFRHKSLERINTVRWVQRRIPNKDSKEALFLKKIEKILDRSSSTGGKILNFIFFMKHYSIVFNADYKHWI